MKTARPTKLSPPGLFRSFWIAGFECSCHINTKGQRLDMTAAVHHDRQAAEDYALLPGVGIRAARDGVRWHLVERCCGEYDFSSWTPMLRAAREQGIQVIWDLCHYGWPEDLDIFSPAFADRFARFCAAVARVHREESDEVPFWTPVNEISFFSWAACRKLIYPHARGRDAELKHQLIRAAIAGTEAVRSVDARARVVCPEPLIHIVPPLKNPANTRPAELKRNSQFEAWEMISGRCCPELGGHPRYLDIVGVNYYAANQWEVPGGRKLHWDGKPRDPRWRPLALLLEEVHQRYNRPLFLAETSHYGIGRAAWIREIGREVAQARCNGVPVQGVCLYPILDRFDWNNPRHWHNSGLFDFESHRNGYFRRVLNPEYARGLREVQEMLAGMGCQ
jgi:beta-glucosidase/6-phospho-beta-glucosidase/beta-galactosidase